MVGYTLMMECHSRVESSMLFRLDSSFFPPLNQKSHNTRKLKVTKHLRYLVPGSTKIMVSGLTPSLVTTRSKNKVQDDSSVLEIAEKHPDLEKDG